MSVITIHYVVSWFGVLLKFMRRPRARVLACLCARGKLLNSEASIWHRNFPHECATFFFFFSRTTTSVCVTERARVWVAGVCVHILFDLRSRDSPSVAERESSVCAATVDGASERPNYSCVICFTSCLRKPPHNQPSLSAFWRKHKIGLQWLSY